MLRTFLLVLQFSLVGQLIAGEDQLLLKGTPFSTNPPPIMTLEIPAKAGDPTGREFTLDSSIINSSIFTGNTAPCTLCDGLLRWAKYVGKSREMLESTYETIVVFMYNENLLEDPHWVRYLDKIRFEKIRLGIYAEVIVEALDKVDGTKIKIHYDQALPEDPVDHVTQLLHSWADAAGLNMYK